jgi:hypothetical protein
MNTEELSLSAEERAERRISVSHFSRVIWATADLIMRRAFGTFTGVADPSSYMGDAAYVRPRWKSHPSAAFAAEFHDEVVGSSFAANWGCVGFSVR